MPTIAFDRTSATYSGRQIPKPTTLTLVENHIDVIGESGDSKSMLMRLVNGLGSITGGMVTYEDMNATEQVKTIRKRVGFIFSDADNQIVVPAVVENTIFLLRKRELPRDERNRLVQETLGRFGLADHADVSPHVSSGGQEQLLALVAALVLDSTTIITDKPTTLLGLRNRLHIRKISTRPEQQTIVVAHGPDFLTGFDRVTCVNTGEIADDDALKGVIDRRISDMVRTEEGRS